MIILRYKKFSDSKKRNNKEAPLFLIPGLAGGIGTGLLIGKKSIIPEEKAVSEAAQLSVMEAKKLDKDKVSINNELKKLNKSELGRKLRGQTKKYNDLLKKAKEVEEASKKIPEKFKETVNDLAKKNRKSFTRKSAIIGGISGLAASGIGYGIYKHTKNKKNDNSEK